jgi:hypothetical protein
LWRRRSREATEGEETELTENVPQRIDVDTSEEPRLDDVVRAIRVALGECPT